MGQWVMGHVGHRSRKMTHFHLLAQSRLYACSEQSLSSLF